MSITNVFIFRKVNKHLFCGIKARKNMKMPFFLVGSPIHKWLHLVSSFSDKLLQVHRKYFPIFITKHILVLYESSSPPQNNISVLQVNNNKA